MVHPQHRLKLAVVAASAATAALAAFLAYRRQRSKQLLEATEGNQTRNIARAPDKETSVEASVPQKVCEADSGEQADVDGLSGSDVSAQSSAHSVGTFPVLELAKPGQASDDASISLQQYMKNANEEQMRSQDSVAVAAMSSTASPKSLTSPRSPKARIKGTGRVGEIIQHDPADKALPFKVAFEDDGSPVKADWFNEEALELVPEVGNMVRLKTSGQKAEIVSTADNLRCQVIEDDGTLTDVRHDDMDFLFPCAGLSADKQSV